MPTRREDPVLRSARREAIIALLIWLLAGAYTVGYCYFNGYGRDVASITYVFGFPDWVFWGIVVPWSVCTGVSFVLSYFVIRDEDLGQEEVESDLGSLEDALGGEGERV